MRFRQNFSPNPRFPDSYIIKYYLTLIRPRLLSEKFCFFHLLFLIPRLFFFSAFFFSPFSLAFSLCHGGTLAFVISLQVPRFVITPLRGNVLRKLTSSLTRADFNEFNLISESRGRRKDGGRERQWLISFYFNMLRFLQPSA